MCGKYGISSLLLVKRVGSPPHVREIPARGAHTTQSVGITPACAGNTENCLNWYSCCRDHPRMCGKYVGAKQLCD